MSLRQTALRGIFWTGLSSYFSQALQLLTTLVLAGLLGPADFGTFALAGVVIGLLGLVRGLGLGEALIQLREESAEVLDTVFWLLLPTGVLLFAIGFALASVAADFFATPAIEPIIRVLSFSFILFALQSVHERLLQRRLRFRTHAVPGLVGGILYAGVALSLAWRGLGVWSIVYASVAASVMTTTLYWILVPYRPAFRFSWGTARQLLRFGGFAQANTVLIFLHRILDRAVVGRLLGTAATGQYDLAFRIGNFTESRIAFLFLGVAFPLYARMQGDKDRLARAHLAATRYLGLAAIPLACATVVIGPSFIEALYGDKWMPAVPALVILSCHGLSATVLGPSGIVLYALGRPELQTRLLGIQLTFVLGSIYFAAMNWGLVGVAAVITAANLIASVATTWLVCRLLGFPLTQILRRLALPLALSLAVLALPLTVLYILPWGVSLLARAALALLGYSLAYAIEVYLFDASVRAQVRLLFRSPKKGLETLLSEGTG